jgi:uncharacterized membrane protein
MTFDVHTDPARPDRTDSTATGSAAIVKPAKALELSDTVELPVVRTAVAPHQREPLETTSRPAPAPPRRGLFGRPRTLTLLPLLLVLGAQAVLSLRLGNTASPDEALVVLAGREEISNLLHGEIGTTDFAGYFSGQPVLYPVLAAAVESRFGLEAVRLLSLLFMLGATTLLWSSTRALFGRSAALGAAMVFGLAGPTLFLGHFAVYDVPAVLLFAASLRMLIAAAPLRLWTVLFAVPTTVLAIATSYATALYVPVLALVAAFSAATAAAGRGRRFQHLARAALFTGVVGAALVAWFVFLGSSFRQGLEITTTNRPLGSDDPGLITGSATEWGIAALVLGLLGTLVVVRRHRAAPHDPHRVAPVLLTLTLAASVALAPAYQLHIHTFQSLQKHIVIGLLFSAAAAGAALSIPLRAAWRAPARYGVAALAALVLAAVGTVQSVELFRYWPNSAALVSVLKQAMGKGGGHYLAEASTVPQYYTAHLPSGARNDWENTYYFGYADSKGKYISGLSAYRQAIADHYFKLIVLSHSDTPSLDKEIDALLKAKSGYRMVKVIPFDDFFGTSDYTVWEPAN